MKRLVLILAMVLTTSLFCRAQNRNTSVTLFPVPLTIDKLTVGMKSMTASKASSVELRNFIGRKLQSIQSDGKNEVVFNDMQQYPEGVYMVLIKDGRGKIVEGKKFTIAK